MAIEIKMLAGSDANVLLNVAAGVFDHPLDQKRTVEFLNDPRHHIAVAIDAGLVVGFVSAVHYVHPDKKNPELWINEVAVAASHRKQGLATELLRAVIETGRGRGCGEAWVLTDRGNEAAMRLYTSLGGIEAPADSVMFTFFPTEQKVSQR